MEDKGGQAEVVWTCHEDRPGEEEGRGRRLMEMELPGKRKAEKKISGCSEREYGESWCKGEADWKKDTVEEYHVLWQPQIKMKD